MWNLEISHIIGKIGFFIEIFMSLSKILLKFMSFTSLYLMCFVKMSRIVKDLDCKLTCGHVLDPRSRCKTLISETKDFLILSINSIQNISILLDHFFQP